MTRSRALLPRSLALSVLLLSLAAHARTFQGFVTHVTDGDSLWVRASTGGAPREVRLQGIDAPEICQPYGREARDALASLALQREVVVQTRARDRYQRVVARVFVGSRDVGARLVARGYAWSDGYRGRGGPYARQQAGAMGAGLGLWAGAAPVAPREFRRRHGPCH
jgi:micrococcal nuclease